MNQNNNQQQFIYTYNAKDQREIDRIREKYTVNPKDTKLKRLHDLDAGVHSRASAAAIAVGTIGALLMGTGMSVVMTEIGQLMGLGALAAPVGIAVGVAGLAVAACAYPVYRTVGEHRKKKIAPEIIRLLDELDREQEKKG